jgi:hypothetical protein
MTDESRVIFNNYQIRKSKKQKTAFIEYVKQFAESRGYKFSIENGSFGVRNIVIGDPDRAKAVFTAHYDTCPVLPVPNFITPKNILYYVIYQIILVVGIVALLLVSATGLAMLATVALDSVLTSEDQAGLVFSVVWEAVYFSGLILMLFGPANEHTANDNTSGVITLVEIMSALPEEEKDSFAFVFFDLEETGLIGSSAFAKKHKASMKNKLLLNFDCVSDGNNILLALKKGAKGYAPLLEKCFAPNESFKIDVRSKNVFYPSDQAKFNCGVGITALKYSKLLRTEYMDRIHTLKDTVFEEENIEFLKNCTLCLADELTK